MRALLGLAHRLQILVREDTQVTMSLQNLLEESFVQFRIGVLNDASVDHLVVNGENGFKKQLMNCLLLDQSHKTDFHSGSHKVEPPNYFQVKLALMRITSVVGNHLIDILLPKVWFTTQKAALKPFQELLFVWLDAFHFGNEVLCCVSNAVQGAQ